MAPMRAVYSDHAPLSLALTIARRLRKWLPSGQREAKVDRGLLSNPRVWEEFRVLVARELGAGGAQERVRGQGGLHQLTSVLDMAAKEVLMSRVRVQPGWFGARADDLLPLVERRNQCQAHHNAAPTPDKHTTLKSARLAVVKAVGLAK